MGVAEELARRARAAQESLARADAHARNEALTRMAAALRACAQDILEANERDVRRACEAQASDAMVDRLALTPARVEAMAAGLEAIAAQPDPLGRVQDGMRLASGLSVERVTVPLGVVAMVYEARPNVTSDAAGLCVKTGNAVVLRGGSAALETNVATSEALRAALGACGLPKDCVCLLAEAGHAATDELMGLTGLVDVLIPRGGAGLIRHCVERARVPVIETGTGNCHVYVHASADEDMALSIIRNAKCSRPGVCNACESVLVDAARAQTFLPRLVSSCAEWGVLVHADEMTLALARAAGGAAASSCVAADEEDWGREYLALELSCKVVGGLDEAVRHVRRYGTGHSECIVTQDYAAAEEFLARVDAACVYVNASTRFTDGGMFGLGAEIGISTQKLHARGPMGADALVTTKYLCRGSGQVRE